MKYTNNLKTTLLWTLLLGWSQSVSAMEVGEHDEALPRYGQGRDHYAPNYAPRGSHYGTAPIGGYHHPQSRQEGSSLEECSRALDSFMEARKDRSRQKNESYSWLFDSDFKERNFNSISAQLRNSIQLLGKSFFNDLWELVNAPNLINAYEELLKKHNFVDISKTQTGSASYNQRIYVHSDTGFMVRIKTNPRNPSLSLSMYTEAPRNIVLEYLNKGGRLTRMQEIFEQKSGNEACKIYFSKITEGGKDKLIVQPVPHAPKAVSSAIKAAKSQKCDPDKLSSYDLVRLQRKWVQMVMDMGHIPINLVELDERWVEQVHNLEKSSRKHRLDSVDPSVNEEWNEYGSSMPHPASSKDERPAKRPRIEVDSTNSSQMEDDKPDWLAQREELDKLTHQNPPLDSRDPDFDEVYLSDPFSTTNDYAHFMADEESEETAVPSVSMSDYAHFMADEEEEEGD